MNRRELIKAAMGLPLVAGIDQLLALSVEKEADEITDWSLLAEANERFENVLYTDRAYEESGMSIYGLSSGPINPEIDVKHLIYNNIHIRFNHYYETLEDLRDDFRKSLKYVPENYTHIYWRHKPEIGVVLFSSTIKSYFRLRCRVTCGELPKKREQNPVEASLADTFERVCADVFNRVNV